MIAFDFSYCRPETVEEAVAAWADRAEGGGEPFYLAGSTEIVSGARGGGYRPSAVIDIKRIPECRRRETIDGRLYLGAALSLSELADGADYPLLAAAARGVADRSVRNRITLGGNAAGRLPYREALVPLLLADARVHLAGPAAADRPGRPIRRTAPLRELYGRRLTLNAGELVLGFSVPKSALGLPFRHQRRTRTGPVDYPLVMLCAVRDGDLLLLGVSGAHPQPVWAQAALQAGGPAGAIFPPPRDDARASAAYRAALLEDLLLRAAKELA